MRPSYDRRRMPAAHFLDAELRKWLRKFGPHQVDLAQRLNRSQGWVNKYMNGVGHATIDDAIRIAAILIGVDAERLTKDERRLVRDYRRLSPDRQQDAQGILKSLAGRRRSRTP
jgi:transcriptional regulator with XRE-family HTH domain